MLTYGPNGPTTGGVQAIYNWANNHNNAGFFMVSRDWQNLIVAGSNGDTNAIYKPNLKKTSDGFTSIGTDDVRNDADWTQHRARNFNGKWRDSSKGGDDCQGPRILFELIRTKYNV